MKAPSARVLRTGAVIFLGVLVVCAATAPWTVARAQSSQTQSPPEPLAPAPRAPDSATAPAAQAAQASANSDAAEMTSEEASVPLRVMVNLVPVRVIVRHAKGKALTTHRQGDFQLSQDGKPQLISNFSV